MNIISARDVLGYRKYFVTESGSRLVRACKKGCYESLCQQSFLTLWLDKRRLWWSLEKWRFLAWKQKNTRTPKLNIETIRSALWTSSRVEQLILSHSTYPYLLNVVFEKKNCMGFSEDIRRVPGDIWALQGISRTFQEILGAFQRVLESFRLFRSPRGLLRFQRRCRGSQGRFRGLHGVI